MSRDTEARPPRRIIVPNMRDVPDFATEREEREFWATHELAADAFGPGPLDADEEAALARARERRRPRRPASA